MKHTALAVLAVVTLISACATSKMAPTAATFDLSVLPDEIRVPVGNKVAMEAVGVGQITYECRPKKDAAGQYVWVFVGPDATLNDRNGKKVGKYIGPPATWEGVDGSRITGTQLAVSPASPGNIAWQIFEVDTATATGKGSMNGVSFIQRVATKGGVAPATGCDMANNGKKVVVNFQADYIFYKAA
jgi:hypothetical protein